MDQHVKSKLKGFYQRKYVIYIWKFKYITDLAILQYLSVVFYAANFVQATHWLAYY